MGDGNNNAPDDTDDDSSNDIGGSNTPAVVINTGNQSPQPEPAPTPGVPNQWQQNQPVQTPEPVPNQGQPQTGGASGQWSDNPDAGKNNAPGNPTLPGPPPSQQPGSDPIAKANAAYVNALRAEGVSEQEIGNIMQNQGQAQAANLNKSNQEQAEALARYQTTMHGIKSERDNALKDLNNGHLKPNQFYENMGTPEKIGTALGMIIGGMGAGGLHQENPVMKWLNDQTERDIQSQKFNINSAYNHYLQQTGDTVQAYNMTKGILLQQQANNAAAIAAKSQGDVGKQNGLIMQNKIQTQIAQLDQQNAIRRQLFSGGQNAQGGQQLDPARKLRLMQQLGPQGGGIDDKTYEQANKELESAQKIDKLRSDVTDSFNNLNSQVLAGALTPGARDSDLNTFSGILAKESEGRFNFDEAKQQMMRFCQIPAIWTTP